MAAATSSNRFTPLSIITSDLESRSPPTSPQSPRNTSPTRSDASLSRSTSPSPSNVAQPYRSNATRRATYPEIWSHTNLPPIQLASCGFRYFAEFYKDACICHVCNTYVTMQELDTEKEHSNNDILCLHAQDCILADTLFDLMNNPTDIYTMTDRSRSRSFISSPLPLSPVKSTRECISSIGAAANSPVPSPSSSSDVPMEASPSTPHLPSTYPLSPARPSYAAVAARPPSTLRTPTPKDQRPPFPKPLSSSSPQPTNAATSSVRATTPHQSSPSSSPVLSIHDLERRFRNRLSPIQDRYNQQCRRKPPSVTLARLLHAVADLLGSCDANDALNTCHSFALN